MQVYSVAQINSYIQGKFESDARLSAISVAGELSNVKYHYSGHIYFTLKDSKSQLACVMFSTNRARLGFTMKEGQAVTVTGSISVFVRDGKYQLYADSVTLSGEGELYERYEKLRKELSEMGMFDELYKQPIPRYIKTLGVVTAPTGAAVRDIINVSRRRFPYIQIILFPAKVQGEGAALSVAAGIKALDDYGVDCIIVGRGGGSIEDLWAFNEIEVARAIFECKTPIISAVGHQSDTTISDWVADRRAATPSEAAELAVFDYSKLKEQLDGYRRSLDVCIGRQIAFRREQVARYEAVIKGKSPKARVREMRMRLMKLSDALPTHINARLTNYKRIIEEAPIRLNDKMAGQLREKKHELALLCASLEGLSPIAKLSQGYSVARTEDGRVIRSATQVNEGQFLSIHLLDGQIDTSVTKIHLEEKI